MQKENSSLPFLVYCTTCKCRSSPPRASSIECDNGHQLAANFPYDTFWNYCCGCNVFYRSTALEKNEEQANCLCCDRRINRRFFCQYCEVMTLEAARAEAREQPVQFAEDGTPFPSCPGCLRLASAADLLIHDCYHLYITFLTEREVCPFCKESITTPATVKEELAEVISPVTKANTNSFAFFESFAKSEVSFLNWRSCLPSSRTGWIELVAVLSLVLTAIGLVIVFVPSVPAAISYRINKALKKPLSVSPIECTAHFVLAGERLRLIARAEAPFENLKFDWVTNAGRLINHKEQNGQSEVELDTSEMSVLTVPKEVSVRVSVGDEFGETVLRHERITVMPRRLANNPPVLRIPPRCNCTLQEVVAGENVSLYAMAEDEDQGEVLNYQWQSSTPSAQLVTTASAAGSTVILNTAGVNPRTSPVPVKIYLTVNDGNGGEVMGDITIMVLPKNSDRVRSEAIANLPPANRAPKLEAFMADKTTIDAGEQVRLWAFVTDADGDSPIYYDWRASAGDIQNKNETAILTTTGISTSEVVVFLTVADGRGGRTSQRLFVTVRSNSTSTASPSPSPAQTKGSDGH